MSYFKPKGIDEIPSIKISGWRVMRVESKLWEAETDHLVGYNRTEGHGRVSSAIVSKDLENQIVTTESGRNYKLFGDGGFDPDGAYVWSIWCRRNQIFNERDVSGEYIDE